MGGKPQGWPVDTWLLRGGLAFVFAYAATSVVTDPTQFDSYLPGFVPDRWVEPSLVGVAAFELLLVLGLATGRCLYAVSMASAAMLGGVVVLNLDSFDVVFRNVAIVTAALALAVQARRRAWDTGAEPRAVAEPRDEPRTVEEVVELADDLALDLRTTVAVVTPALPSTRGPRNGTAPVPGAPAAEAPVTSQEPA